MLKSKLQKYDILVGGGFALAGYSTRHGGGKVASHRERSEHAQKVKEARNAILLERNDVIDECIEEIKRVVALNMQARIDRADDELAFEFQGIGRVLCESLRNIKDVE